MKLYFLLLGTTVSLFPLNLKAQCVATQDCAALGYTEASCNGGKGVKCPFGNKWACLPTKESVCKEEGFTQVCKGTGQIGSGDSCGGLYKKCSCDSSYQYTCTSNNQTSGAGLSCDGKYAACNCASGYEWKGNSCQLKISNGAHGDLYYCNGKVVAVKASGMDFYVGMKDLGNAHMSTGKEECSSYVFCGSTKGTLPSISQLRTIYKNKSTLESLLVANGGTKFATDDDYCSATIGTSGVWSSGGFLNRFYSINMSDGSEGGNTNGYIRPILEL